LTQTRRDVAHRTLAFHAAFEATIGRASVGARQNEQRDQLRHVTGGRDAVAILVEIELEDRQGREVAVEVTALGGRMEALTGLTPRRSDIHDKVAAVGACLLSFGANQLWNVVFGRRLHEANAAREHEGTAVAVRVAGSARRGRLRGFLLTCGLRG